MTTPDGPPLPFALRAPDAAPRRPATPWRVLVVDDDPEMQLITELALRGLTFEGRPIMLIGATSAAQAFAILSQERDIALVLLDVVMEREHAGLELIGRLRHDLRNSQTRVILRTGQPGYAPEEQVVVDYDINQYLPKTETTATALRTAAIVALRSYRQILEIEQVGRTRAAFLAVMSHELRTPLNIILGFSELIRMDAATPDRQREWAGNVVGSGRRLLAMIEAMIDRASLESMSSLAMDDVDLGGVVDSVLARLPRDRQPAITTDLAAACIVRGNAGRLGQALGSLVTNALSHASARHVLIRLGGSRESAEIEVADDGTGIAEDHLRVLLDPISIRDNWERRGVEGIGLGLSTARRITELHGGTLDIRSAPGAGTAVTMRIPRRPEGDGGRLPEG